MKRIFLFTVTLFIGCGSGSGSNSDSFKEENVIINSNEIVNSIDIKESGNYIDEAFFDEMTFD